MCNSAINETCKLFASLFFGIEMRCFYGLKIRCHCFRIANPKVDGLEFVIPIKK